MRLTQWKADLRGETWSHEGGTIEPAALRDYISAHTGETVYTSYGRPILVSSQDPDDTYHLFLHVFDPRMESSLLTWRTTITTVEGRVF